MGLSAGISFTSAEVSQNLVSKALGKLGGWVATIFNYDGSTSSPSLPSEPLNPIPTMTQAWHKVSEVVTSVIGIVPISYQWIKTSGNSKFLLDFLKTFEITVF
ncbi:hypothetical protein OVS_00475 [Mycoplasma ovis str. Michigan]|uniref:Uncharacterized protein n=1 Tax=Mycoplasma ovis str. Michigan TaxID=1415773 RepID=A0ABN4BMA6_9MOLU|nr:hypothetical protein [Mycoplasma ovis]AHC40096.1 hypothetical protein OVS_00475 [Mycoplasma ovis str. Michigan]